ncbi:glycosyltransferase family 39 protein [Actinomadura alba]|uniref:Glycosyltransferase family 39 protein n=1 Tax=Actinomadura alba TaxID=406431 RepID=A0ABR7LU16_9ACTN|nr:glycosyltransferase family 39 protein [Actinomadura alba]MBC6468059.1 glycosyltransferase family 39 protein [Actinomadura alba]
MTSSPATTSRPRWALPALVGLLAATAALYLCGLSASGWANAFYSAAVQAGATSWKAFFFGSSDASNFITVDKTPAALWPMALAARMFGFGPWSVLAPQALMGVATVGVLYATVRRTLVASLGPRGATAAGLLAGAAQALTPVAALMFRFNNPDALLVLLLTLGAYGMVRAQERGSTRWLVFAGACVGFAFLAKMLQAFLVVPPFALVYLVTSPAPVLRRLWQLALAGIAMIVSAGWWVAIVAATPASSRPYIGGSQRDSVLELAFGYNGLGRLTGNEVGGLGNLNQQAGWTRLFASELGGQISWLLPAALILLAAGLWATRYAPRTDPMRAAFGLWGGWLLVTGAVFSFMQGIFHAYYAVALAPPIAALAGMGACLMWRLRAEPAASTVLAATSVVTAVWAYVLLGRTPNWYPWLPYVVGVGGLLAGAGLLVRGRRMGRVLAVAAVVAVVASLSGPAAYALDTAGTPHRGAIPSAGPAVRGGFGSGGMGRDGGARGPGRDSGMRGGGFSANRDQGAQGGQGGAMPPGGSPNGAGPMGFPARGGAPGGGRPGGGGPGGGGPGGLLDAPAPSADLTALLKSGSGSYTWVAAVPRSNNAAGYQLATGEPVMALGGFNGTDPAPTLAQFQAYVAAGKVHYYIDGRVMGAARQSGGSDQTEQISQWVQKSFTSTTVGGTAVYDLTKPAS